jgi:hypothetical protein
MRQGVWGGRESGLPWRGSCRRERGRAGVLVAELRGGAGQRGGLRGVHVGEKGSAGLFEYEAARWGRESGPGDRGLGVGGCRRRGRAGDTAPRGPGATVPGEGLSPAERGRLSPVCLESYRRRRLPAATNIF